MTQQKLTLQELKYANPGWFSIKNRRFFGDLGYGLRKSKSGGYYLIQKTNKWSDMFGKDKEHISYVLHPVVNNEIQPALDESFDTLIEVKQYLRGI